MSITPSLFGVFLRVVNEVLQLADEFLKAASRSGSTPKNPGGHHHQGQDSAGISTRSLLLDAALAGEDPLLLLLPVPVHQDGVFA